MTLGLRIRTLRKAHGMTQQQLADATGVSRIYIQALESNRRSPSMKLLHRLAERLEVETSGLLEEFPRDKGGRLQLEELFTNPDTADIWYRGYHLSPEDVITLSRVIDALFGPDEEAAPRRGRPRSPRS